MTRRQRSAARTRRDRRRKGNALRALYHRYWLGHFQRPRQIGRGLMTALFHDGRIRRFSGFSYLVADFPEGVLR